jgi:hypothetical protein
MKPTFDRSPIRLDNILSVLVIAVALGCTGYAAIAAVISPLAA